MENIQFQQMVCDTGYPQTYKFLKLKHHHIHLPYGKSIIGRTIQYVKHRTESFEDYFPCRNERCKLEYILNWFRMFIDMYNRTIPSSAVK
jgi:putative transposase